MKTFYLLSVFLLTCLYPLFAQLEPYALNDYGITSIDLSPSNVNENDRILVAGTDSNGVYMYCFGMDCGWQQIGFAGLPVSAVHIQLQGAGPKQWQRIFAALPAVFDCLDSALVYYYDFPDGKGWVRADSGLNRDSIEQITSFTSAGFSGQEPPQPVFCCAETNTIYQMTSGGGWSVSWRGENTDMLRVLYNTDPRFGQKNTVWAGGMNSSPLLWNYVLFVSSEDNGATWKRNLTSIGEVYSCYSIASAPGDNDTLYAGLNGAVVKTTDAGQSWSFTSLNTQDVIFYGLAVNPQNPRHVFAGGVRDTNQFAFYETKDGGLSWENLEVDCDCPISGITCMRGQAENNDFVIYLGTQHNGIFINRAPLTRLPSRSNPGLPQNIVLYPNYPNPFNPQTTIVFETASREKVSLTIYDINGRRIRRLLNTNLSAGRHSVQWDGCDDSGRLVASGIYVVTLKPGKRALYQKIVLAK